MELLASLLPWVQIGLSIFLVALVLLQQNEAGLGGAFGGADSAGNTHKRRGGEKIIFDTTIIVAVLFVSSIFLSIAI